MEDEEVGVGGREKRVDLDDLFPYVGEYGRYQKLLTWLIVLPACIPCGLQGFNQLFMADQVDHFCRLPQFLVKENGNFTDEELRELVLPRDAQNETLKCEMRNMVDWPSILRFLPLDEADGGTEQGPFLATGKGSDNKGKRNEEEEERVGRKRMADYADLMDELENRSPSPSLIPCPDGWEYRTKKTSIVADFDLVCGKEIYPTMALFLVNFGGLVGVFFFGILTDWIGRKAAFFVCLTFEMIGGLGCILAEDFWIWTLFRVITGLTVPAIYQIPFIICLELVGGSYRSFVTVMTCLFYVGGMMLLPLIAFVVEEWRLLSFWTTAPFLLYYIYAWFLPESPRWLMAQKRVDEALEVMERLARVNGTRLPGHLVDRIRAQSAADREKEKGNDKKSRPGLPDLFRSRNMRLKTILLTFCWFANATVYVGLSFYGPSLGENPYLSFFLGSAVEIPGYLLSWLLMDRWGRRWPLCLAMIIGGLFNVATLLIPPDSPGTLMVFYLIAKLGISASYLMIYPFGGELYPTEVRGVGLGFSAYIGGIGICLIPLINYLGRSNLLIPLILMGVLSVLGGLVALRLPETLNTSLPNTVQEGEAFGRDFGWRDCLSCGGGREEEEGSSVSGADEEEDEGVGERMRMSRMRRLDDVYVPEARPSGSSSVRRKRLVRQGSTLEAPTDSKGAIIITPWW